MVLPEVDDRRILIRRIDPYAMKLVNFTLRKIYRRSLLLTLVYCKYENLMNGLFFFDCFILLLCLELITRNLLK